MAQSQHSSDSEELDEGGIVVIDPGSSILRAGFSDQDQPQIVMPSVLGRRTSAGSGSGSDTATAVGASRADDVFYGEEALANRDVLQLRYPVCWGLVNSWDDLHVLWKHVFQKLDSDMTVSRLVVMEGGHMNPKMNREKMTETAFETFSVPSFYLAPSSAAILGGTDRTTGLVIDLGEHIIRTIPVYEGHHLPHAVMKFDFGGAFFTDSLFNLLKQKGVSLLAKDRTAVKDMKEKLAYVAQDFGHEKDVFSVSQEKSFTMPDGDVIKLGTELFECVEGIFQPSLLGFEMWGLAEHAMNTVIRCDSSIREELLRNVVLGGAGSRLPGLASRLQDELEKQAASHDELRKLRVKVVCPPQWGPAVLERGI